MELGIAIAAIVLALYSGWCMYGAHQIRLYGNEHHTMPHKVIYPAAPRTFKWGFYITMYYLFSPIWMLFEAQLSDPTYPKR